MSADLLRRAAEKLRHPYLCNWPVGVPTALADWLEYEARDAELDLGSICGRELAVATARAILREESS
jgi:hypothetical protein